MLRAVKPWCSARRAIRAELPAAQSTVQPTVCTARSQIWLKTVLSCLFVGIRARAASAREFSFASLPHLTSGRELVGEAAQEKTRRQGAEGEDGVSYWYQDKDGKWQIDWSHFAVLIPLGLTIFISGLLAYLRGVR